MNTTAGTAMEKARGEFELLGVHGAGSDIVEAALTLCGAPFRVTAASPWEDGPGRDRLTALNPQCQVPTLVLPDGTVMTESAAMILHLADHYPAAGLVPDTDAASRPFFLRWLIFLVATLYPTFTMGDDPSRWVSDEVARLELRRRSDEAREAMWRQVEAAAGTPWFLGDRFSALDLYIAAMVRWRPRPAWFAQHCPRVSAIADATRSLPGLQAIFNRDDDG
jgi:GST-like protein